MKFSFTVQLYSGIRYFLCERCSKCQFGGRKGNVNLFFLGQWLCGFFRQNFHHEDLSPTDPLIYAVPSPVVTYNFPCSYWFLVAHPSIVFSTLGWNPIQNNFLLLGLMDSWEIQAPFITPEARSCGGFQRSHFPSICSK